MPEEALRSTSATLSLPDEPNLDWLRKQAKRQLAELRKMNPAAKLADAQFTLARQYGFASWRALKAHIDSLTLEGQLFAAARSGDLATLSKLLDAHPEKLHARNKPYEHTLLHVAAFHGQLAAVDHLLRRGLDPNLREKGDNTCPMHWAAAGGHLDVVRRLIEAGGDVIGAGDDHALEIIGWASCWEECNDENHRAIVDLLLSHGARHHIFSAIAMNLADEVRRIVAANPAALSQRMSRNEDHRLPLHFAVRMNRPQMVELLIELGADPLGVDSSGFSAAAYAVEPGADRGVMRAIRALTESELTSAARGHRPPRIGLLDLLAALALGEWDVAASCLRDAPGLLGPGGAGVGALHLLAKRGDVTAAHWLLQHGADPNARWAHWDSDVTPLHMAVLGNHPELVRLLLASGADPAIHDTKHDSDALGWAEFFRRDTIIELIKKHAARPAM